MASSVASSVKTSIHQQIVTTWLNGDDRGFDDDTDLQGTGILDSFSTLSLVAFIDETFKVQLDPVDINAETFKSVSTISELVETKLSATK
jgi:acyl carrier protein